MGRRKPRREWEAGLTLPLVPYTPEEICRILAQAGKEFPPKKIQGAIRGLCVLGWKAEEHSTPLVRSVYRLGRAANGYIVHCHDIEEAPRLTEVWAALEEIHVRTGALQKTLDSLQDVAGVKVRAAVEELQVKVGNLLDTLLHMDGKTEFACQLVLTRMVLERDPGRILSAPEGKEKLSPQQEAHLAASAEANDFLMDLKARMVAFHQYLKHIPLPEPRRGRPRKAASAKVQTLEGILRENLRVDLAALRDRLRRLLQAAERVRTPEPGRGRPRRGGLQRFIRELGEVYRNLTGKKPGAASDPRSGNPGPFVRFVNACLEPLGHPLSRLDPQYGNQSFGISIASASLAKRIQRAFRPAAPRPPRIRTTS